MEDVIRETTRGFMTSSFQKYGWLFALAFLLQCASGFGDIAEDLIAKGDISDQQLQASDALKYYVPAERLQPRNADLLARIARQYRHLMEDAAAAGEKRRLGRIALDYSDRAVAIAPENAEAQLAVAISLGKILPLLSMKEQVTASYRIKDAADAAIRIDPHNDLGWHVLGRWNRVLAEVSGTKRFFAPLFAGKLPHGTYADAAKCLEKALDLNPNRLKNYIELGRVYAETGNAAEARRLIEKGLTMPNVEKDDPEEKQFGREALAKLH